MSASPTAPLMLTCALTLKSGTRSLFFAEVSLSSHGVAHLPSPPEVLKLAPGTKVETEITLPNLAGAKLSVPGRIFRERTRAEEHLGLDFDWADQSFAQDLLQEWIRCWGKPILPNRRKHPRLASPSDPRFPRLATVRKANESVFEAEGPEYAPWKAQVANLSIEGVLLTSSDTLTEGIEPGDGLQIVLEPSGPQGFRIETVAGIRRITETLDPHRNQLVRAFGLRFEWLDAEQREVYQGLIRALWPQ